MSSAFTQNKNLEEPASGDYVNTWAAPVNSNWSEIDTAFGGVTTVNTTGASGTITLTATQYRPPNIIFAGSPAGTLHYRLPSGVGGLWTMYNNSGSTYAIVIESIGGGTSITLPAGYRTMVVCDGTNVSTAHTTPFYAGGSSGQVQFNNGGVLAGSAGLTTDGVSLTTLAVKLAGATSGVTTLQSASVTTTWTYTLPSADGTTGQVLTTNGAGVLSWSTVSGGGGPAVNSISFGSTGLTPSTATLGTVTVDGVLNAAHGGTGQSTYVAGDLLYASSPSTLSRLASSSIGNVLVAAGVGVAPTWAPVNLGPTLPMVTGYLGVANGGTGNVTLGTGLLKGNGTAAVTTATAGVDYVIPSGNVATASALQVTHTINGVGFNGTSDIIIPAGTLSNSVTFNNSGSGDASGVSFNGGTNRTVSYNTIGAPKTDGTNATGTWNINVLGNAATATSATSATSATTATTATTANALNTGNNYQINSLGVGTAAAGTTGNIRATGDITSAYTSDRRFKENIQPITYALHRVRSIGGHTFDWTDDYIQDKGGEDGYFIHKADFGVIAQDVQAHFPRAVRERQNGTLAVDYVKLCALAFAAIDELAGEVDQLRGKLNL